MNYKVLTLALSALLLGGCCATNKPAEPVDPSYVDGYRDGCESGLVTDISHIKKKDYRRAESDRAYFHGWDEGFTDCRYNIYRKSQGN